ncbi:MAG: ABC transporter ATP-binding protein [Candidatus Wallbacteria bacterium]|nr:ABC transporter ATP-binding protein [Candidatus Wallbacteria bacterium]
MDGKSIPFLKRLLPYFGLQKKRLILSFITVIVITCVQLCRPMILRYIIDKAIPHKDLQMALNAGLLFVLCLIVGAAFGYLQTLILSRAGMEIIRELKSRVFSHVLSQGMSFFDKNQPGKLLSRTESDTDKLKDVFTQMTMALLTTSFMLIGILAIILREQPGFGIWLVILSPILLFCFHFYLAFIFKQYTLIREKNAELTGYIAEYVQGVPLIQLYSIKQAACKMLLFYQNEKVRLEMKANFVDTCIFWSAFSFISEVLVFIWLFIYSCGKIFQNQMSIGTMVMYFELTRQFFYPLLGLLQTFSQLQSSVASGNRIFELFDTRSEVLDNIQTEEKVRFSGSINFENISFSYALEPVLKNVSFEVKKGEHLAIVGASGSGKTTCTNLLLRFYDPQSGRITIDGRDIRSYRLSDLRRDISLVLQEIYLFPGTIMENLKFSDTSLSDERVIEAARLLGAHEFIARKPDGYNTVLSERGGNLSLGERQLLSFTRALIKDPEILILDEATSSVDVITEHRLQESLKKLMEGRTAIIIAHRLSTIRNADKILVFENGEIVEQGRHDDLLARGGIYDRLIKIQAVASCLQQKILSAEGSP